MVVDCFIFFSINDDGLGGGSFFGGVGVEDVSITEGEGGGSAAAAALDDDAVLRLTAFSLSFTTSSIIPETKRSANCSPGVARGRV